MPAGAAELHLTPAQEGLVLVALAEALRVAAAHGEARAALAGHLADQLDAALGPARPAHPALPPVGTVVERRWTVGEADTAAALGHPDPEALVLASPRLALLFEIVASGALGAPVEGATHLGTGILVHHLGRAEIGDEVVVRAELVEASGRRGTFACSAESAGRLLALGVHQRMVVERAR
jgi:predicted thioesterase